MTRAVLHTLGLALWRDRGALVMAFVLPVLVFVIFAAIFGGATGEQLRLRVAVADELGSPWSSRLVDAVAAAPSLRLIGRVQDRPGVEALVASGAADVGLVIRRHARALDDFIGEGAAPLLVVTHPARSVAGALLAGTAQRLYFSRLPDAALRGVVRLVDESIVELSDEQRLEAAAQLEAMTPSAGEATSPEATPFDALVEQRDVTGAGTAVDQVAYYAAAVAALFVLLSAVHAASSIHDEVDSGIVDRLLAGPAGLTPLIDGRAVFLVLQGIAQATLIFLVAWLGYGVDVTAQAGRWAAVTVALGVASAGLMLVAATLSRTARQAQTVSNVAVLVLSAAGGSMVPRFLMPPWLQAAGWATPNAWVIEGYAQAFAPAGSWLAMVPSLAVLLGTGLAGWAAARRLVRRWETA